MTKVLTVDDSKAIRMIVGKQCVELGFEVEEAEDGEQGLAKLAAATYDIIVLDVTMPVLDGPGMLRKMRELGNNTPVLLLTSESKRSIVAEAMALGIDDYILKPFKPEEFAAKLMKGLKMGPPTAGARLATPVAPAPGVEGGARQFVNMLVIDDMENVAKKLRSLLDPKITMNASVSAQAALTQCHERVFNVILIDTDIPDVDTRTLIEQLRLLQPNAAFVALMLRTANDVTAETRKMGFESVLFKPFEVEMVEQLVTRYFESEDFVSLDDNVLKVSGFAGKPERLDNYYSRVGTLITPLLPKVAAACHEDTYLDVTSLPLVGERLVQLVMSVRKKAESLALQLRILGSAEAIKMLAQFDETKDLPSFATLAEAKNASA